MTMGTDTLLQVALSMVGGLAAVGYTVLKLAMSGMEKQHEATQKMITEKFQWAEDRRQDSKEHWEEHFDELKQSDKEVSQRMHGLETRVSTLEINLGHHHPPITLRKPHA